MKVSVRLTPDGKDVELTAGADTWASRNLIDSETFRLLGGTAEKMIPADVRLTGVDGAQLRILGRTRLTISTPTVENPVDTDAYVLPRLDMGVRFLIGDPGIRALVRDQRLQVKYGDGTAEAFVGALQADRKLTHCIEDTDCIIRQYKLKSVEKWEWHFQWKWKTVPPQASLNGPGIYFRKNLTRDAIETAVSEWTKSGVVEPTEHPKFLVPLNPIPQNKVDHPVRITGDFEPFNRWIIADSTEESNEVCADAIRLLRAHQQGLFMDLSKAYQSIFLADELRDYNAFRINNQWFRATRLLFGLSIGQKVLYLVLRHLLSDRSINYRDDVFVPSGAHEEEVIQILEKNSFKIKDNSTWRLEELQNGGKPKRVLGLEVFRENGTLFWKRPSLRTSEVRTAKDLASALGEAASSHLPCLGPVRAKLSILRSILGKFIGNEHQKWKEPLPNDLTSLWETCREEVEEERKYEWLIHKSTKFRLYTDASGMLIGGLVRSVFGSEESQDLVDFCSIHRCPHINIAELEGVVFGLQHLENYAPRDAEVEIITDSKSTRSWVAVAIRDGIVRTKALNKSLIRHRVQIIKEMFAQNRWKVSVKWVESSSNPADKLTRVSANFVLVWRAFNGDSGPEEESSDEEKPGIIGAIRQQERLRDTHQWDELVRTFHHEHLHPGQAAMLIGLKAYRIPNLTERVQRIVGNCVLCRCKRPVVRYENLKTGHPQPLRPWEWLQIDTLSISNQPLLKAIIIIDEYSRWIEYHGIPGAPAAADTVKLLTTWFARHKPQRGFHIRADRGTEFRNSVVCKWISDHGGQIHFSTVRRPTACGLVERVNRTLLTLMRTAKHMFPTETPVDWLRKATHEYWNRPHSGLNGATPNEKLKMTGEFAPGEETIEEIAEEPESWSGDDVEEDPESQDDLTIPRSPLLQTNLVQEQQNDHPSDSPQRILAYVPPAEKLDLGWQEATVLRTHENGSMTVLPSGHRATTLNQQFLQPIPSQLEEETVIASDSDRAESPRRSVRNRRTPARYM